MDRYDLPEALLTKLYDKTGNSSGGNRGFIIFYVDPSGTPNYYAQYADPVTKIAIEATVEQYVEILNESSQIFQDTEEDD